MGNLAANADWAGACGSALKRVAETLKSGFELLLVISSWACNPNGRAKMICHDHYLNREMATRATQVRVLFI